MLVADVAKPKKKKKAEPKPEKPLSVEMALAQIRKDSQEKPKEFLEETVVPFGGE